MSAIVQSVAWWCYVPQLVSPEQFVNFLFFVHGGFAKEGPRRDRSRFIVTSGSIMLVPLQILAAGPDVHFHPAA